MQQFHAQGVVAPHVGAFQGGVVVLQRLAVAPGVVVQVTLDIVEFPVGAGLPAAHFGHDAFRKVTVGIEVLVDAVFVEQAAASAGIDGADKGEPCGQYKDYMFRLDLFHLSMYNALLPYKITAFLHYIRIFARNYSYLYILTWSGSISNTFSIPALSLMTETICTPFTSLMLLHRSRCISPGRSSVIHEKPKQEPVGIHEVFRLRYPHSGYSLEDVERRAGWLVPRHGRQTNQLDDSCVLNPNLMTGLG